MKATLLLAEAATIHPDGTASILRAGITRVWGDPPPVPFKGALYVRIEPEMGDGGPHSFDLVWMDEDGKELMPKIGGNFESPPKGGNTGFVIGINVFFHKYGPALFVLRIDSVKRAEWKLECVKNSEENGAAGEASSQGKE